MKGPLTFESTAQLGCPSAPSCSGVGVLAATTRGYLYFELGHEFDWRYLTPALRQRFSRMWGHPNAPWLDSARSMQDGSEDGMTADFAAVYEMCAWGLPQIGISYSGLYPRGVPTPPPIRPMAAAPSCELIRRTACRS